MLIVVAVESSTIASVGYDLNPATPAAGVL